MLPLNSESIRKLFEQVRSGRLSPDEGVERLRHLPFEDLGFAKVDHHRALRVGMPEVIFGQGKSPAQLAQIFWLLAQHEGNILATRASKEQFAAVKKKVRNAEYRQLARAIVLQRDEKRYGKGIIAVVSAGTSDIPVAEEAVVTAGVETQVAMGLMQPASIAFVGRDIAQHHIGMAADIFGGGLDRQVHAMLEGLEVQRRCPGIVDQDRRAAPAIVMAMR